MPFKSSETILESRKWYFKYFAKIISLGAPDENLHETTITDKQTKRNK